MQGMMHCLNPSILERQRAQLQLQQQQAKNNFCVESFFSLRSEGSLGDGWPHLNATSQYPITNGREAAAAAAAVSTTINASATVSNSTSSVQAGKAEKKSPMKRKADKSPILGGSDEEEKKEKKIKEGSRNIPKANTEDKKPDYIRVRARRGQATDSHSLAERVRRERISERMKYLQGLVPGCNKITGKAGMLDEIINYVQSLQRQVEFLSMKLAAVNPRMDINVETLFSKEIINLPCNSAISSVGMLPSEQLVDPAFIQFNSLVDMAVNPTEAFLDSCLYVQKDNWDRELHNLYGVEFSQELLPSHFIHCKEISCPTISRGNCELQPEFWRS